MLTTITEWFTALLLLHIHNSAILLRIYKTYKFFLRALTGTTELSRICTPTQLSQPATSGVPVPMERLHGGKRGLKNSLTSKIPSSSSSSSSLSEDDSNILWTEAESVERIPLMRSRCKSIGLELDISVGTVYRVDRSILYSSRLAMQRRALESRTCDPDSVFRSILREKHFPNHASPHTPAALVLRYSLYNIAASHSLSVDVGDLSRTKYDPTNPAHERRLLRLWEIMRPGVPLEDRYTDQWQDIGFQGKDPSTDFRGMGLLGLEDLLYYGAKYPELALHTLEGSRSNLDSWYSYAIVGINITSFAVECLHNRSLQYFLFRYGTSMDIYHEFYCYLFASFHHYWITRTPRPSIMQFTPVFEDFKTLMRIELQERKPVILDEASPALYHRLKKDQ